MKSTGLPLILAFALLAGCAGPQSLRSSYVAYSNAFADANNEQLLLNLARLRNGHPPFFLQLGAVTAQFNFTGGLTGSHTRTDPLGPDTLTSALGLNLGATEAPTFSFTPLRGEKFANVLTRRMQVGVLRNFISQDLSLAILLRITLQSATLDFPASGREYRIRNAVDPRVPGNYADFLRLVANLDALKRAGTLDLDKAPRDQGGRVRIELDIDAGGAVAGNAGLGPAYPLRGLGNLSGKAVLYVQPRTFLGVMIGVASEEGRFAAISPDILDQLPVQVRHPVLRLTPDPADTEPATVSLSYAGQDYRVSDRPGEIGNRAAFAFLQFLASQTELDPAALPAQQLIQVQ